MYYVVGEGNPGSGQEEEGYQQGDHPQAGWAADVRAGQLQVPAGDPVRGWGGDWAWSHSGVLQPRQQGIAESWPAAVEGSYSQNWYI